MSRWLWHRIQPSLWPILIALVLALLTAAVGLGLMGLAGWAVSSALVAGLGGGATLAYVSLGPLMLSSIVVLRGLAIGRAGLRYVERLMGHDAVFRMIRDLRISLFKRLGGLDLSHIYRLQLGQLLASLVRDVDSLDGLVLRVVIPVTTLSVVSICLLTVLDGAVAWFSFGVICLVGIGLPALMAWLGHGPSQHLNRETTALNTAMLDFVLGQKDLLAASAGPAWINRLMASSRQTDKNLLALAQLDGLATACVQLVGGVGALVFLHLLADTPNGLITLQDFGVSIAGLLIVIAVIEICAPIPAAFKLIGSLREAVTRLQALDGMPDEIKPNNVLPPIPPKPDETGQLILENVTYSYPGQSHALVQAISLTLKSGVRLGVVGPSGCGKSTLAALMSGFLTPDCGSVRLFGRDIGSYEETERYRRICYIPQGGGLFDVSLRDNMRLADPEADDSRIEHALDAVGLQAELSGKMKTYLDLRVGERGSRLSGGQGRRLAVARALLRNPDILIVDEPTDGLDNETAREVLTSICAASHGRILIIISHDTLMSEFTTETLNLALASNGPAKSSQ